MPDDPMMPPPVRIPDSQPTVYSPSPVPGQPAPQRRAEDTKTYAGEKSVLAVALLGWASMFMADMAAFETWDSVMTPGFIGVHIGQLFPCQWPW